MRRRRIRKVQIHPRNARDTSIQKQNKVVSRSKSMPSGKAIVITPKLYEENENYSNSLKGPEKRSLFSALDNYATSKLIEAKNINKLPNVNMVFHGHWGWVFAMMVKKYKKHIPGCNIISSVNPIPGCDVYQYWRPASKEMAKLLKDYPKSHDFFRKGIHMIHDSPYDTTRANTAMRIGTMNYYHTVICTSLEQKNYYQKTKGTSYKYIPLGVGAEFIKKNKVNDTPNSKIRLGFIGRLYMDKIKGEEDLVKLAHALDPSKFEFVIISPNAEEYVSKIRSLGFTVYDNKISSFHRLYRMIDVSLILSKHEGTPLPLIESIKLGTYVLGKPVGEVPVVLPEKQIIKSVSDLITKLNKIWADRTILKQFYDISDTLIENRTWENFTQETEKIWKAIW